MSPLFLFAAVLTLAGAGAALSLRNLVHCALAAVGAFVGLALLFVDLGAPFVGLAQILVNVGAVAILILVAILLTRGGETTPRPAISGSRSSGLGVAMLVGGSVCATILSSRRLLTDATGTASDVVPTATVRHLGERLMTEYVLPLEVIGLLLTAALIGAVLLAKSERGLGHKLQAPSPEPQTPSTTPG
jgi:NADH-quinone oxidoreductase subunit J